MAIKFVEGAEKPEKKPRKRGQYLSGKTAEAQKPWEAEGIGRRTWYRRRKKAREK